MDPVTMGIAGAIARAGKGSDDDGQIAQLLTRVLGPTADVIGQTLGRVAEIRLANIGRIVENADKKLGDRANGPGSVPLRVIGAIVEDGSYSDDRIFGEYLGGVLASAKTKDGRDDRAARWVKVITSLSAYDVRLHYLLYTAARELYVNRGATIIQWGNETTYSELTVILDHSQVLQAMEFSESEDYDIVNDALFVLNNEGLVSNFMYGQKQQVNLRIHKECPYWTAVYFTPTTLGVQLCMWAQGRGSEWRKFSSPKIELPQLEVPTIAEKMLVSSLPPFIVRAPQPNS